MDLLHRLMSVEKQMRTVMNGGSDNPQGPGPGESETESAAVAERDSPGPAWNDGDSDRQTFVGEISMPAIDTGQDVSVAAHSAKSASSNRVPSPREPRHEKHGSRADAPKQSREWLRRMTLSHGIIPEDLDCERLLNVCLDEVHILYPFLHPPSVRQTYEYLWTRSLLISQSELEESQESKLTVAIVFICLALGQCTASSRVANVNGVHSAGWSLYGVALDLVRPYLDVASDLSIHLQSLQVLTLMASLTRRFLLVNRSSVADCRRPCISSDLMPTRRRSER